MFDEIGGLDEEDFKIAFNDVDLCLRLGERGYLIAWTPFAELYHHESASLGLPETEERRAEWLRETFQLRSRWREVVRNDPCYNPNLSLENGNFEIAKSPRVSKPWIKSDLNRVLRELIFAEEAPPAAEHLTAKFGNRGREVVGIFQTQRSSRFWLLAQRVATSQSSRRSPQEHPASETEQRADKLFRRPALIPCGLVCGLTGVLPEFPGISGRTDPSVGKRLIDPGSNGLAPSCVVWLKE